MKSSLQVYNFNSARALQKLLSAGRSYLHFAKRWHTDVDAFI